MLKVCYTKYSLLWCVGDHGSDFPQYIATCEILQSPTHHIAMHILWIYAITFRATSHMLYILLLYLT